MWNIMLLQDKGGIAQIKMMYCEGEGMEMQVNGCGVLQYFHKCVQVLAGNSGGKVGRNFDSR